MGDDVIDRGADIARGVVVRCRIKRTYGIVLADEPVLVAHLDAALWAWVGVGLDGRPWASADCVPVCDEEGETVTAFAALDGIDAQLESVRRGLAALGATV